MKDESGSLKDYKLPLAVTLAAVILGAVGAYWSWRDERRGPDVEFVVPDGFHGIFVLKEDRRSGVKPERNDNLVRYIIPESGVLITTDSSPLGVWHSETARYSSGRQVPYLPGTAKGKDILIGLTHDNDFGDTFLIGTHAEETQYWQDHKVWFKIESDKR